MILIRIKYNKTLILYVDKYLRITVNDDHRRYDSQHHHTVGEKACELSKDKYIVMCFTFTDVKQLPGTYLSDYYLNDNNILLIIRSYKIYLKRQHKHDDKRYYIIILKTNYGNFHNIKFVKVYLPVNIIGINIQTSKTLFYIIL